MAHHSHRAQILTGAPQAHPMTGIEAATLMAFTAVMMTLAISRFRKRLD